MTLDARVTHAFPFPREVVFDAWLDPQMIGSWMFGPAIRDESIVHIEVDARVGGEFSFLVNRQNTVIDHIGTYLVINRPEHLEFKWGVKGMSDSSRVIIDLARAGSGCNLTLVHELHPDWKEYFERTKEGWAKMLQVLQQAIAKKG
jgi:uncharacterized protein YndB with AHSA1/START domain